MQKLYSCVNEFSDGSPSRIRIVLRISFGITTLPRSSIRLTIPVAFIKIFDYVLNVNYVEHCTDKDCPNFMHFIKTSAGLENLQCILISLGLGISSLNRFKLHCNNEFAKYGLDPIGKPTEMMMDTVVHEMSEGFDYLELFDDIMADWNQKWQDAQEELGLEVLY